MKDLDLTMATWKRENETVVEAKEIRRKMTKEEVRNENFKEFVSGVLFALVIIGIPMLGLFF